MIPSQPPPKPDRSPAQSPMETRTDQGIEGDDEPNASLSVPDIVVSEAETKEGSEETKDEGNTSGASASPDLEEGKVRDMRTSDSPTVGWEEDGGAEKNAILGQEGGEGDGIAEPGKLANIPSSEVDPDLEGSMSASLVLEQRAENFLEDTEKKKRLDSGKDEEIVDEKEKPLSADVKTGGEGSEPLGTREPLDSAGEVLGTSESPTETYNDFDFVFEASQLLGELVVSR